MAMILLLAALCAAPAAWGQQTMEVRQGDLDQEVRVIGTVVTADIFRLKSTIEGRADQIWTTTGVWANPDQDLGLLLNKEFAALMDAHSTTDRKVLAERWKPVYQPTHVRCPYECFILKSFVPSQAWVKPRAILFEAAASLRLMGRVRPEEAHLVRDGMLLDYWAVNHPARRLQTRVAHYLLDVQGEKVQPGGSMDIALGPDQFLPPGTDWEGLVVPTRKKGVLMVPTNALLRFGGDTFLPVKISTGITTRDWTEIEAGVEAKRKILILVEDQILDAQRHKLEMDYSALRQRLNRETRPAAPKPQPRREPREPIEAVREPDAYMGADPASE